MLIDRFLTGTAGVPEYHGMISIYFTNHYSSTLVADTNSIMGVASLGTLWEPGQEGAGDPTGAMRVVPENDVRRGGPGTPRMVSITGQAATRSSNPETISQRANAWAIANNDIPTFAPWVRPFGADYHQTIQSQASWIAGQNGELSAGMRVPGGWYFRTTVPLLGNYTPVSIEQTLNDIVAGVHDARYTDYATRFATWSLPVICGFAHEVNGGWYKYAWGNPELNFPGAPTLWKAAWERASGLIRAAGNVDIELNLAFNNQSPAVGAPVDWLPSPSSFQCIAYQVYGEINVSATTTSQLNARFAGPSSGNPGDVNYANGYWCKRLARADHPYFTALGHTERKSLFIGETGPWSNNGTFNDDSAFMEGLFDWMAELKNDGVLAGVSPFMTAGSTLHRLCDIDGTIRRPNALRVWRRRNPEIYRVPLVPPKLRPILEVA